MDFLILSGVIDRTLKKEVDSRTKISPSAAADTFMWNMIEGIDANLGSPAALCNTPFVGTYPKYYRSLLIRSRKWKHAESADDEDIGFINLPVIKQIQRTIRIRRKTARWAAEKSGEQKVLLSITPYSPFLSGIKKAKRTNPGIITCAVVTDLPKFAILEQNRNPVKKLLVKLYSGITRRLSAYVDTFVLLTEQMKDPLGVGSRPYAVIEGFLNTEDQENLPGCEKFRDKKVVLYSGSLTRRYGLPGFVEAFLQAGIPGCELWICGCGEMEAELGALSERNSKIRYIGNLDRAEVLKLQRQAALLVNPRTNQGEYTRYSFPSKTLEYMGSGTPMAGFRLDGIPDEYYDYMYVFEREQVSSMADKLREILSKDSAELERMGKRAKDFVTENKNCAVQAKKLLELFEKP